MTEIKFRAWDSLQKKMYSWEQLKAGEFCSAWDLIFHPSDTKILQLFTGLTDKSWREVYDGDIIAMNEESMVENSKSVVVEYYFGTAHVHPIGSRFYCSTLENTCFNHLGGKCKDGVSGTVIGNIFEHQNLLEQMILGKMK